MQSMKTLNDQLPKNSLPVDSMGTIQSRAEQIAHPQLSIYNAHGIVTPNSPNTLLVHA